MANRDIHGVFGKKDEIEDMIKDTTKYRNQRIRFIYENTFDTDLKKRILRMIRDHRKNLFEEITCSYPSLKKLRFW